MIFLGSVAAAALALWVVAPVVWATRAPRDVGSSACPNCGPRPESDARFCSNCGVPTAA